MCFVHDLKIYFHFFHFPWYVLYVVFYAKKDGKNARRWIDTVHYTAHERKQLSVADYVHFLSQRTGERWREERVKNERSQNSIGENEKMRKRKKREEILWPARPASHVCLCLLIRLIWLSVASQVMPCTWNFNFLGADIVTLTWYHLQEEMMCRSRNSCCVERTLPSLQEGPVFDSYSSTWE